MLVLSRSEARAAGLKRYFTGTACKAGHVAERYTNGGNCAACLVLTSRTYADKNREVMYAQRCAWARENPGKNRAQVASARYARNTPAWSDLERIKQLYIEAADQGLTVDHVYPAKGKRVSGLHVPENLQFLTGTANARKSNTYPFGQPDAWSI